MFKVGKVSYLNTVPLFYRFEDLKIELVEGEPSTKTKGSSFS